MIDHNSLDEDRSLFDVTKVDIKYNPKDKMSTGNNITMTIDHSLDAMSDSS